MFRNFPLSGHPEALPAAKAAYCAGQQDPKLFWAMADWLFTNQDGWSGAADAAAQFRTQVLASGADGSRYDACLSAAGTTSAIESDFEEGAAQDVSGTPAFFLVRNAAEPGTPTFISGAQDYPAFAQAIETLLAAQ